MLPDSPDSPPTDADWQRKTAVNCNNLAWDLLAVSQRTADQDRELLDLAHAAAYHWGQIGTELQRKRAEMLLAETYACLGHGVLALSYSTEMRNFFHSRAETPAWERAFAHAIHAHGAYVTGELTLYQQELQAANEAFEKITDTEERALVLETLNRVAVSSRS